MTLHVNDGGTWKQAANVYVNDAGVWKEVQEIYVNDAGTWKSVFVNDVIALSDFVSIAVGPTGPLTSLYALQSDGEVWGNNLGPSTEYLADWIAPKTNMANYECFASQLSGDAVTGTLNAWQSLATTRSWSLTRLNTAVASAVIQVQIRRSIDAAVLATATISIELDRE
jgi:hypothetical protein